MFHSKITRRLVTSFLLIVLVSLSLLGILLLNYFRDYTMQQILRMIEREKNKFGWEFLFLGANIDAIATASQFGIDADRAVNYHADSRGTALNYEAVSRAITHIRCSEAPMSAAWKAEIDEDFRSRESDR